MPYMIVSSEDGSEHCVHKQNEDKSPGEKMKCYPDKEEASKYLKALYAATEGEQGMNAAFQFTELGAAGKQFDGMAAGKFTAFSGEDITIDPADLPAIVEKTQLAIASTAAESGEPVGLPIDEDAHNHAGGAGWIIGVELDKGGKKIRFTPNWTEIGLKLIKDNIRRFFSVSVDLANKVILGGSLTNWPATRNKDGLILLRPIELSQSIYAQETPMADENKTPVVNSEPIQEGEKHMTEPIVVTPEVVETATPEPANPTLTELLKTPEAVKELGKIAESKAKEFMAAEARKRQIVEFASTLVGGSKDAPYGLPVKADEVVAILLSLPPAQAEAVQTLLTATMKASVNFMTNGAYASEFNSHPHLPAVYHGSLRMWMQAGRDVKSFFAANTELGKAEDYNLSEFVKEA